MANIKIFSNVEEEYAKFKERANKVPDMIDKTVALNASIALRSAIFHIDKLIYQVPAGDYSRTKNLRRGNKIRRLDFATWLLFNDVEYSGYVHDGTSQMEARPWMATAIKMTQPTMTKNLEDIGIKIANGDENVQLPTGTDVGGAQDSGTADG